MKGAAWIALAWLAFASRLFGADITALTADRALLERVYHAHRTGAPRVGFEEAMPPPLVETLVRSDLKKEAVLQRVYGVTITPVMVEAEAARIDATTRAPAMLEEIKIALGHDPARFARTLARPLLVERILRGRFDNDDTLHAARRHMAEAARTAALAARPDGVPAQSAALRANKDGSCGEHTWQLAPASAAKEFASDTPVASRTEIAKSGVYSVEASAQIAGTPPPSGGTDQDRTSPFEDLDPELQKVLAVQLQKPGDVSAVIETPASFLVFLATGKNAAALSVCSLSIPKRSYEAWLAEQPGSPP